MVFIEPGVVNAIFIGSNTCRMHLFITNEAFSLAYLQLTLNLIPHFGRHACIAYNHRLYRHQLQSLYNICYN